MKPTIQYLALQGAESNHLRAFAEKGSGQFPNHGICPRVLPFDSAPFRRRSGSRRTELLLLLILLFLAGSAPGGSLLLTPRHGDDGSAWKQAECAACHPLRRIHQGKSAAGIRGMVRDKEYASCMGCHGSNGTGRKRPCVICHNPKDLPARPHRDGSFRHDFAGMDLDGECVTCHLDSDMDGRFEMQQDLTLFPDAHQRPAPYFSNADFCLRCHNRDHQIPGFQMDDRHWRDPLVAMEDNYRFIDCHGHRAGGNGTYRGLREGYAYASRVDCTDCHAMHGTENTGLLIDLAAKGASRLDPALGLDAVPVWTGEEGQYAQLCVLCHRMDREGQDSETDTGNGLPGLHQASGDCRDCHAHGQAGQAGL